jgi:peptidoglycan/xylan/chitin deacetylase (PgdA/CDA1 family)
VQTRFDLGVTYVTPEQFEKQIASLHAHGYSTIAISELLAQSAGDLTRKVIITFDDAFDTVYFNALPILKKYDYRATVFAITDFIGMTGSWDYQIARFRAKHCNWEQLRVLAAEGWEVGSHTVSHPDLTSLSASRLWYELKSSKDILAEQLQRKIEIISYPFGKYDNTVLAGVKKAGYAGGCTLGHNTFFTQEYPYALFRRGVYRMEPLSLFHVKLNNGLLARCDDVKQRFFTFCAQGTLLFKYFRYP